MAVFQIYGGSANDEVAAFGNGLTLAVVSASSSPLLCSLVCSPQVAGADCCVPAAVYATAHISGGHVNPAVTWATCLSGHMPWARGGLYMAAQLLGAIFGALVSVRGRSFQPFLPAFSSVRHRSAGSHVAVSIAVRPAAQRDSGRRRRARVLHPPERHPDIHRAALVVGDHHDLPAGHGECTLPKRAQHPAHGGRRHGMHGRWSTPPL